MIILLLVFLFFAWGFNRSLKGVTGSPVNYWPERYEVRLTAAQEAALAEELRKRC